MTYTFRELRKDSRPTHEQFVVELEEKLKYTKKTVKRNEILKELMYWKAEIVEDDAESDELVRKFFERYPVWQPKG